MPGRKFSSGSGYRYGFNGKENDKNISAGGQDYGMRIYDNRLGRFLSVDPLTAKYPMLTPYQFASNRPIEGIDLDGKEFLSFHSSIYQLTNNGVQYNSITHKVDRYVTLEIVYENVPTQLQNPQTCGLKFVSHGPINGDGTTYDASVNGAAFIDLDTYYHGNASFKGVDGGVSTNGIPIKGNAIPSGGTGNIDASNINSLGSVWSDNGAVGLIKNAYNWMYTGSEQGALNKEGSLYNGFTSAVSAVDNEVNNGILQTKTGDVSISPQQRASLINFVADGSLNYDNTIESMKGALTTAFYGTQIINRAKTSSGYDAIDPADKIKNKTRQAISDLNSQYKKAGGGNEFDKISEFYNDNN